MGELGGEIIGAAIGSVAKAAAPVAAETAAVGIGTAAAKIGTERLSSVEKIAETGASIAKTGIETVETAKSAEVLKETVGQSVAPGELGQSREASNINPANVSGQVEGQKTSGPVGSTESWARFGASINKKEAEEEERRRQERRRTEELVKIRKLLQERKAA